MMPFAICVACANPIESESDAVITEAKVQTGSRPWETSWIEAHAHVACYERSPSLQKPSVAYIGLVDEPIDPECRVSEIATTEQPRRDTSVRDAVQKNW